MKTAPTGMLELSPAGSEVSLIVINRLCDRNGTTAGGITSAGDLTGAIRCLPEGQDVFPSASS